MKIQAETLTFRDLVGMNPDKIKKINNRQGQVEHEGKATGGDCLVGGKLLGWES